MMTNDELLDMITMQAGHLGTALHNSVEEGFLTTKEVAWATNGILALVATMCDALSGYEEDRSLQELLFMGFDIVRAHAASEDIAMEFKDVSDEELP